MGQTANEVDTRTGAYRTTGDDANVQARGGDGAGIDEVAATRAEIERTRAEMSQTIDSLQERLNPQHLVEQAKESVKEATLGRAQQAVSNAVDTAREFVTDAGGSARGAGVSLMDVIQENPIPAALAGLGLGWLWMSARSRSTAPTSTRYRRGIYDYKGQQYTFVNPVDQPRRRSGYSTGAHAVGRALGDAAGQVQSTAGDVIHRVQDTATDMAGQVQDRVGSMAGQVQDKVGDMAGRVQNRAGELVNQAQDRAGDLVDQVQDRAGQLAQGAQYQAQQGVQGFQQMVDENPLSMAAVFLALGAAVGLAVPETPQEHRLMGETRDQLLNQAQGTAQDMAQKVQSVASQVLDTAKQEVNNQGLTDKVQNVVQKTVDTARSEAHNQGLPGA